MVVVVEDDVCVSDCLDLFDVGMDDFTSEQDVEESVK